MGSMTFAEKVFRVVSKIPRGSVMTYKEVARAAGRLRAYRAVGNILNKNPYPMCKGQSLDAVKDCPLHNRIEIPCHRVVQSSGKVGGYVHGARRKAELLKKEGIKIQNDYVRSP